MVPQYPVAGHTGRIGTGPHHLSEARILAGETMSLSDEHIAAVEQ
jgi:hypothetical protein